MFDAELQARFLKESQDTKAANGARCTRIAFVKYRILAAMWPPAQAAQWTGSGWAWPEVEGVTETVLNCHIHSKPDLACKLCRKYKHSVRTLARIEQQRGVASVQGSVEVTNSTTFNFPNLLRGHILGSDYFKSLCAMRTCDQVVQEIEQYARDAEPYVAGTSRSPSTLFCCLYKLCSLGLTEAQVTALLDHKHPLVRVTGFLFLRFVHPPEKLWDWFEPYLLDDEPFASRGEAKDSTFGTFVEALLSEDKYCAQPLPRLPVRVKQAYGTQLVTLPEHRQRKQQNRRRLDAFCTGAKVTACSDGSWKKGVVEDCEELGPGRVSVIVTFEDGHEDAVDLGLVILRTRDFGNRESGGAPATKDDLLEEFRRRERRKATASRRDHKRPRSPRGDRRRSRSPQRAAVVERAIKKKPEGPQGPSREHLQRMQDLMQRYTKNTSSSGGHNRDLEGQESYRLG